MSDLDDFFAKKDKKGKNKTNKKKGMSNDDLEKKFEEKPGESFRVKKFTNLDNFIQDEGEWNDFVDDENKDYSGLKIQTLSIKDKEEEQREEEESTKKEQALPAWKVGEEGKESGKTEEVAPSRDIENDLFSFIRKRNAPKINDTIEFPDLGTPSEAYEEMKGFQTVRTSGMSRANGGAGPSSESISTDNKYSALRNNLN